MAADTHAALRRDVRHLGAMLGDVLRHAGGEALYRRVERVRRLSKAARGAGAGLRRRLEAQFADLSGAEALQLARAFAQFLTLANVAEQHHRVRRARQYRRQEKRGPQPGGVRDTLRRLREQGLPAGRIAETVARLRLEFVFTAHPTEIARRSLLQKFNRISDLLALRDRTDLTPGEGAEAEAGLRREITAIWCTDEIRRGRPTPQQEARGGLLVFEQTLWDVVPRFLRALDDSMRQELDVGLPAQAVPLRFGSWMGGDRDGNPNVTAPVTREVCRIARWMAASLYLREVDALYSDLSVEACSEELRARVGEGRAPYRLLLRQVRERLQATLDWLDAQLGGHQLQPGAAPETPLYELTEELREPLALCDRSLRAAGLELVADGRLLDVLRRLDVFGLSLVRLDIRQEAARHTALLDAVTRHLGLGSYAEWDEGRRQRFLSEELAGRRPLIPQDLPAEPAEQEVLETFRTIARLPAESLGAYVISMAGAPSDVLAVELLQRTCGMERPLRVVPLFETLDALQGAGTILHTLLGLPGYRERIGGRQEVMVGYSDSTKQSGRMAAAWALYRAQEDIGAACRAHGVHPTLFHGRGGTVGRGGGPTRQAILSLPPGSVDGRLRLTQQGEMIQAEFGTPGLAFRNLDLALMATLEATLSESAAPRAEWRERLDALAAASREAYTEMLARPDFVPFFRAVTPERELGLLNVGSRPSRRAAEGGLETLRAIPWVFAWTQVRLMLPAWLGVGEALQAALEAGRGSELQALFREWPFFRTTLELIEMVLAKADSATFARYNAVLVPEALQPLGQELLERLRRTEAAVLAVMGHEELLEDNSMLRRSIHVRNPYVDPINLLQVELLRRVRAGDQAPETLDALLVTMNGIAAGMRNTG
jgi:phosphoenolpyruvate carboxylase